MKETKLELPATFEGLNLALSKLAGEEREIGNRMAALAGIADPAERQLESRNVKAIAEETARRRRALHDALLRLGKAQGPRRQPRRGRPALETEGKTT